MSAIKKNTKPITMSFAEVDNKVGNYGEHPFFVKKANEAKKFLKRAGLPKNLKAK